MALDRVGQPRPEIPGMDGFASWQHPFRNSRIYMRLASLRELQSKIHNGFRDTPAVEVGGILLGKTVDEGAEASIVISDIKFVASQTPRYNSTRRDLLELAIALREPTAVTDLRPVGYCRSHLRSSTSVGNREGVFLSEQDGECIETYLRDPASVFLVIRPIASGASRVGFFFWLNGRLETEFSYSEIIIDSNGSSDAPESSPLAKAVPPAVDACVKANLSRQMIQSTPPRANSDSGESHPPHSKLRMGAPRWALLSIVGVLVLAAAAYMLPRMLQARNPNASPTGAQGQLSLNTVRKPGGELELRWNRNRPSMSKELAGTLTISDGILHREVNLYREQLQKGVFIYSAVTDDVSFRLVIYLDSGYSLSETLRVVAPTDEVSKAPITYMPLPAPGRRSR